MIAFITCKSSLVPLLEGLCTSNPCRFGLTLGRRKGKIISLVGVVLHLSRFLVDPIPVLISAHSTHRDCTFFDGYCSTVQGLLDWFEVDLRFTDLSFIQIYLCVLCVFVLYSRVSLSCCPFWTFCTVSPARWECL